MGSQSKEIKISNKMERNLVKKVREDLMMSKAELADKAGVSPLTIDRVEKGNSCRLDTKRRIILGLGYKLSDKDKIFPQNKRGNKG